MTEFEANVISCDKINDGYSVILDQTAFFPQEGGQYCDTGILSDSVVSDVQIKDGIIYHIVDKPLVGQVFGKIDWDKRFRRMQNHTGEHIVSGLIYREYGLNNVGFHLNDSEVTIDIDGILSQNQLDRIENLANVAVFENVKVTASYPEPEQLKLLTYRSKLDLEENVRIVDVNGYDVCACCAPHVSSSGQIGLIKILEAVNYKGGMRIRVKCGFYALEDYKEKFNSIYRIACELSVKQSDVCSAIERLSSEKEELKQNVSALNKKIIALRLASLKETDGNICIFDDGNNINALRNLVNEALPLCKGICAVFCGNDKSGYSYIMGSNNIDLSAKAKEINATLNGRGGGSSSMIQGSLKSTEKEIKEYFNIIED